jgi:hypothetical protein
MLKKIVVFLLIFMFSTAAFADDIQLYKKGTRITFDEDMHCMTNTVSLRLVNKIKICEESYKIEVEGLKQTHALEMAALKKKLDLKDETYTEIINKKDKTIFDIQQVTLKELASYRNNTWLTVTISVGVGLLVGAGIAIVATHYAE